MIQRTACLIARDTDPCRNLAIEKHLMDTLPENTAILFLRQDRHAAVVGRCQNPWHECKVESFLESGGVITRRLSGGDASYQDMGCLSFSFILPKQDFNIQRQLSMAGAAVASFQIHGEIGAGGCLKTGGRRFCQNDFYKSGSAAIHHGVLTADVSLDAMEHYLKPRNKRADVPEPPPLKSRIVNLRELNPDLSIDSLEQALCRVFADAYHAEPAWLDERMMDAGTLDALTDQFRDARWVYPEQLEYDFTVEERFPWGGVSVMLLREGGVIRASKIFTNAMEAALFLRMEQALIGCPFLIGAIGTRFEQKLELLRDPRLLQIAGDVCTLICGRMRAMDRGLM